MNRSLKVWLWISVLGLLGLLNLGSVGLQSFSAETKPVKAVPVQSPLEIARQKANAYAEQFKLWSQGSNQSFEPVFNLGHEAAKAILDMAVDADDVVFEQLKEKMPGYLVLWGEVIIVAPDAVFLAEQSKQHGQPQDVAFFELMAQTLNGYWPSTQEQLDDLSGCSRFGSQDFVRLYGAWKKFQQQYPKAYAAALKEPGALLLADIEDQLLNSRTACDGPDAVAEEFESFVKTYPTSPLTPKIKRRLELVRQNKSDIAFFKGVKYLDPAESDKAQPQEN